MKFAYLLSLLPALAFAHPDHGTEPGKELNHPVRTGNGAWTYEAVPHWGELPDGKNIGPTHGGVVVDPQTGNIFVSTDAGHGILVWQPDGKFVAAIAPECQGFHAMAARVEDGATVIYGAQLGGPNPLRICKIDAGGKLIQSFGGKGQGDGLTTCSHGMAIDLRFDEPRLLVCDRGSRRLVHVDLEGNWIGVHAFNLRRPCTVSILGDVCAVAELEGRVTILEQSGQPVAFLGDNPDKGQWAKFPVPKDQMELGIFTAPHGLSFDKDGNLYVQDWNQSGRVTKLKKL